MPILGADEQFADSVAVQVDRRGAGGVRGKLPFGQQTGVAKNRFSLTLAVVVQQLGIGPVNQQVEPPVAIPVDYVQFSPAAAAGPSERAETQRSATCSRWRSMLEPKAK